MRCEVKKRREVRSKRLEVLEFRRTDPSLPQDAAECADSNFLVLGHNGCARSTGFSLGEFDVASALADDHETGLLELALYGFVRDRLKRHEVRL